MKKILYIKQILLFFTLALSLNSCFIVMNKEKQEVTTKIILSPKPEVEMSDELIRSEKGDMIAFLPKDWFLIDNSNKISKDIFIIAVNPQYNISAVFSSFVIDAITMEAMKKEGLIAAAKLSFENHKQTTDKTPTLVGNYQIVEAGTLKFATYNYSINGVVNASSAVFCSQNGTYYELNLIPMVVNQNPYPEQKELDKYFRSILATIKY